MLRLTLSCHSCEESVLQIDGWITGPQGALVQTEIVRLLEQTQHLILDLKGVRFLDEAGAAHLRHWSGERVTLHHVPPFIRALLDRPGTQSANGEGEDRCG